MESPIVLSKIKNGIYSHILRFSKNTKLSAIGIDGLLSKLRAYKLDGQIDRVYYKYNNKHIVSPEFVTAFAEHIHSNSFLYDGKGKNVPNNSKHIFAVNIPDLKMLNQFQNIPNLKYIKGINGAAITPVWGTDCFHGTKNIVSIDMDIDCTNENLPRNTRLQTNVFSKLEYTRMKNVSKDLDIPLNYPSLCKESQLFVIDHIHDFMPDTEDEEYIPSHSLAISNSVVESIGEEEFLDNYCLLAYEKGWDIQYY